MIPLERLLSWLPAYFSRDPGAYLALRLGLSGNAAENGAGEEPTPLDRFTWRVADSTLTLTAFYGGVAGAPLTFNLAEHTLASLGNALLDAGYDVTLAAGPDRGTLSALTLIDGEGDSSQTDGNAIFAWTSLLHAYLRAVGAELDAAMAQIPNALAQMETQTAEGEWLDFLGTFYAVPRAVSESDATYSRRIIAEVLRPRGNNVAIAEALKEATGQDTTVVDVTTWGNVIPAYNAFYDHDGTILHDSSAKPIYGLFDVETGYDLLGSVAPALYPAVVRALVERLRDAGTHLRNVVLRASSIGDTVPGGITERMGTLTAQMAEDDTADAPDDPAGALTLTGRRITTFNGARVFNGTVPWTPIEDLDEAI